MGEGVRCWQGSCELFGGDHRNLNFQPGPCRGTPGTLHAKGMARHEWSFQGEAAGWLSIKTQNKRLPNESATTSQLLLIDFDELDSLAEQLTPPEELAKRK